MSCTRLVSFALVLALLGGVALPALAMGPTVVPNGVEAGSNSVPDGDASWWADAWAWLRGLLERMGSNVTSNG